MLVDIRAWLVLALFACYVWGWCVCLVYCWCIVGVGWLRWRLALVCVCCLLFMFWVVLLYSLRVLLPLWVVVFMTLVGISLGSGDFVALLVDF